MNARAQHTESGLVGLPAITADAAALRALWVPAIEAAVGLTTPREFLDWMDGFVRPVLDYQMIACGTGNFAPNSIATDRLLTRGFPASYLEAVRDTQGIITLPRGRERRSNELRIFDFTRPDASLSDWRVGALRFELGTMAAVDRRDRRCQSGSYFLFGNLKALPGNRERYVIEVLAPYMHYALARSLERDVAPTSEVKVEVRLTRRESEVLHWLVAGRTTAEIAARSHRSVHTVSNQVRGILRKLGAGNRVEAIAIALSVGLIDPLAPVQRTRVIAAQRLAVYDARMDPPAPSSAAPECDAAPQSVAANPVFGWWAAYLRCFSCDDENT